MKAIKCFVKWLMTAPEVNSRFIFLVHGLCTAVALLILTVAFVAAHNKDLYPSMVFAVSGTGGVAVVGRYLTKKAGTKPDMSDDSEESEAESTPAKAS